MRERQINSLPGIPVLLFLLIATAMGIWQFVVAAAAQAHRDLEARASVAMHWGTFVLTDEPLDEPPQRLRRALTAAGLTESDFYLAAKADREFDGFRA